MKGILIPVDRKPEVIDVAGDLQSLKDIVGGWIEGITLECDNIRFHGYINEEGKLLSLPVNPIATLLYNDALQEEGGYFILYDTINGPVILFGETYGPEDTEVTPKQIAAFFKKIETYANE